MLESLRFDSERIYERLNVLKLPTDANTQCGSHLCKRTRRAMCELLFSNRTLCRLPVQHYNYSLYRSSKMVITSWEILMSAFCSHLFPTVKMNYCAERTHDTRPVSRVRTSAFLVNCQYYQKASFSTHTPSLFERKSYEKEKKIARVPYGIIGSVLHLYNERGSLSTPIFA